MWQTTSTILVSAVIFKQKKIMLTASKGVLVQCDPSIRALVLQIDSKSPGIVLEELDDTHLMIKQDQVQYVKNELNKLLSMNIYNPFDEEQ